jgi:thioredoxin-related protein
MKLVCALQMRKYFSRGAAVVAMFFISASVSVDAAELVMFEQAGCVWCETFDHEIAPIYHKTAEGQRAPLRRVDIDQPVPQDLAFIAVERLAPLFVLVDKGREIGRIRGYPGEDHFWGLLGVLIKKLDTGGTSGGRATPREIALRMAG